MRICFVHEEYPSETNFGGIATYQYNMAVNLTNMGHKVIVIARGLKRNQHYYENGVEIYRIYNEATNNQVKNYRKYRLKVASLLKKLQDNNEIDIIEVPDWGAETIMFEKNRSVPLVVRLHTPLDIWLKYNKNNFGDITRMMLQWEEKMIKKADCITCCSQILKSMCCTDFKLDKNRIIVTPNPADVSNFYNDKSIKKENRIIYVGSLEERKGVLVLAKSLNLFLRNHPDVIVDFIGKDTTRNYMNISTIDAIRTIVNKKYHKQLNFIGQIENKEINSYLNRAKVAIFPSLFDNFPYVVLEAMASGIQIVGSSNSGMTEMLEDDTSVYNTGDYKNLNELIESKYKQGNRINTKNIERLKKVYKPSDIIRNMLSIYKTTITKYNKEKIKKDDAQIILNKIGINFPIIFMKRIKSGVSNIVYEISTTTKKYVIKKYLYEYDFKLINKLYDTYSNSNIKVARPINNNVIKYGDYFYNIFDYIDSKEVSINEKNKIYKKLLTCNRKTLCKETLLKKCNKYYNYLIKNNKDQRIKDTVNYVLKIYENVITQLPTEHNYFNHGDISESNFVGDVLIDFDECNVSFELYDYAVILVKNFVKKNRISDDILNEFGQIGAKKTEDIQLAVKFYLSKILLEKFYLHTMGIIDLFSKHQKKDYYEKYLKILKNI